MTITEKILIPAAEAAALLSMGKSTFWREVSRGNLPKPMKVGSLTRWRVAEILQAQTAATQEATPEPLPEIIDLPIDGPGFSLYRHFDKAGTLLYVGVSINALGRLAEHKSSNWFNQITRVEITNWATKVASLRAERRAIKTEKPVYNIKHVLRAA